MLGIRNPIDASFPGFVPSVHPVGYVERAVVTKIAVSHKDLPKKVSPVNDLETGASRLHRKGMHTAAGSPSEVTHEETTLVLFAKPSPRIVRQAGWPIADVRQRRENVRDLSIRIAHTFGKPWPTQIWSIKKLPANPPSAVAALH